MGFIADFPIHSAVYDAVDTPPVNPPGNVPPVVPNREPPPVVLA